MTAAMPLVTICVPTRNRAALLRTALPTILRQDYPRLEFLLSDNCSSDDTESVCRAIAAGDSRVRYVRHTTDIGLYGNHNFCLDQASGEYVALWHDDDEHDRSLISRFVAFMTAHPSAGVVSAACNLIDDDGAPLGVRDDDVPSVMPGFDYIARTYASGQSILKIPGALIRRSALGAVRFEEQGPLGFADFVLWFRVAEHADVGYLPDRLWSYRLHRRSLSRRKMFQIVEDYEFHLGGYCEEFARRGAADAARAASWRAALDRFLFWALAYEVASHAGSGPAPEASRYRTVFDIAGYTLDADELSEAMARMRRYSRGPFQKLMTSAFQALLSVGATRPLRWASTRPDVARRLLKLR